MYIGNTPMKTLVVGQIYVRFL